MLVLRSVLNIGIQIHKLDNTIIFLLQLRIAVCVSLETGHVLITFIAM